ncbi:MAG: HAMP domain-containing histidine kinase [candidate division KSB1 bacterium]|nr:HAMP domain-containing histidine kinase [candidate division KSB1 bacterium]
MKFRRFLSFRLVFLLLAMMSVFFGLYTYMNIHVHTSHLMENVLLAANRVSDVIKSSTHYSMLLNRRKDLHHTIQTIGNEPGIDGIRIYNKRGEIMFSTTPGEDGTSVDLRAEACYVCHAEQKPLESLPIMNRSRIFSSPQGHRVLGVINPIMNEPLCYSAECHAHPSTQRVLGVLDVKMSLQQVDERVAESRTRMILYAVLVTMLVGVFSAGFIYFMIHVPVKKLIVGTQQIASGNLNYEINIQSGDEIGYLAQSFNQMTRELAKAQDHLCQMAKMASVGKLSATIAHEISNPLAGILTYTKLVLRLFKNDQLAPEEKKSLEKYLTFIKNETARCGDIVKNLLFFSKKTGGDFYHESLDSIIDKSLQLVNHHLEIQGITLEKELSPGDDRIFCDPNQLEQAFIALFVNAVEAMPKGGTLKVKTEYPDDRDTVRIFISDTGYGIPEEVRPNIFDPFFSTKKDEKGVGLGLSVVYGIIQRHCGSIEVESQVNQGTTFIVSLPRQRVKEESEPSQLKEEVVI